MTNRLPKKMQERIRRGAMGQLTWGEVRARDAGAGAVSYLSDRALDILWEEFSNVQAASDLLKDQETMARFEAWLVSGKDDDAWS